MNSIETVTNPFDWKSRALFSRYIYMYTRGRRLQASREEKNRGRKKFLRSSSCARLMPEKRNSVDSKNAFGSERKRNDALRLNEFIERRLGKRAQRQSEQTQNGSFTLSPRLQGFVFLLFKCYRNILCRTIINTVL